MLDFSVSHVPCHPSSALGLSDRERVSALCVRFQLCVPFETRSRLNITRGCRNGARSAGGISYLSHCLGTVSGASWLLEKDHCFPTVQQTRRNRDEAK